MFKASLNFSNLKIKQVRIYYFCIMADTSVSSIRSMLLTWLKSIIIKLFQERHDERIKLNILLFI